MLDGKHLYVTLGQERTSQKQSKILQNSTDVKIKPASLQEKALIDLSPFRAAASFKRVIERLWDFIPAQLSVHMIAICPLP